MSKKSKQELVQQARFYANMLNLNNTALYRKAFGLSYTREDILSYNTAKMYREGLQKVKRELRQT